MGDEQLRDLLLASYGRARQLAQILFLHRTELPNRDARLQAVRDALVQAEAIRRETIDQLGGMDATLVQVAGTTRYVEFRTHETAAASNLAQLDQLGLNGICD